MDISIDKVLCLRQRRKSTSFRYPRKWDSTSDIGEGISELGSAIRFSGRVVRSTLDGGALSEGLGGHWSWWNLHEILVPNWLIRDWGRCSLYDFVKSVVHNDDFG